MTNHTKADVNVQVGELVHQHMWRQKVTQTTMADALGIGQPAVARKLRGERPFSVDELLAVASHLNLPITEFLPNAGSPHQDGPGGGDATNGLGIKSPKLYQLSYRGTNDDTNAAPAHLDRIGVAA